MGASLSTIVYEVTVAEGVYVLGLANAEAATSQLSLALKENRTYRFDCSGSTSIPLLSITDDGSHTDTDGEGTMGEQSVAGVTYYLNGTALEDIAEGDDATTQFKAGLALGAASEDNPGGFTSLYFDVEAGSLADTTMYYYDADSASMGGSISVAMVGTGTTASNPSYREAGEGDHHPAPPAYRLAGKKAVRSAALQGIEQSACEDLTDGTRRGSNNSGHPPIASGGMVGGGSKGHSN